MCPPGWTAWFAQTPDSGIDLWVKHLTARIAPTDQALLGVDHQPGCTLLDADVLDQLRDRGAALADDDASARRTNLVDNRKTFGLELACAHHCHINDQFT